MSREVYFRCDRCKVSVAAETKDAQRPPYAWLVVEFVQVGQGEELHRMTLSSVYCPSCAPKVTAAITALNNEIETP